MKPYEHISILLTWEGNWTQGNASGAATRDGKHLFTGMLLPEMSQYIFLWSLTVAVWQGKATKHGQIVMKSLQQRKYLLHLIFFCVLKWIVWHFGKHAYLLSHRGYTRRSTALSYLSIKCGLFGGSASCLGTSGWWQDLRNLLRPAKK